MSEFKEQAGEEMRRGEIYWYRYDGVGSEQDGTRPCIIVSNDKNNTFSKTATIVPLTTQEKKPLPTHIDIQSGIVPSTALCEQVQTISKNRISRYIGECTDEEMSRIETGLKIQLGLVSEIALERKNSIPFPAPIARETKTEAKETVCDVDLIALKTKAEIFERLYKELLTQRIGQ